MSRLTVFLLVFISLINPVIAEGKPRTQPIEQCTERGVSPACDYELDHPIDDGDKPITDESNLELIKTGITTSKDLYEMGAITLQQKRRLDRQFLPERL